MNDLDKLHMELFRNSGPHEPYPGFAKVKKGSRLPRGVDPKNLITVPELTASELIAQAKKKLKLTYLNSDLAKWGFVTDEAGKTYEVRSWKPRSHVMFYYKVRKHFSAGFTGNTAAFIAWVIEKDPVGYYASIPEDGRLFPRGDLYTPYFIRGDDNRSLNLGHAHGEWNAAFCFVAFREVTDT